MSSQSNREQFVKQLETILDGIKNNLAKVLNIFTFSPLSFKQYNKAN